MDSTPLASSIASIPDDLPFSLGSNSTGHSCLLPTLSDSHRQLSISSLSPRHASLRNSELNGTLLPPHAHAMEDRGSRGREFDSEADDPRVLSLSNLRMIKEQIYGEEDSFLDVDMVAKQLVEHALTVEELRDEDREEANAKLMAAADSLADLQLRLETIPRHYASREQLQRERWKVENDQLQRQAEVLSRKLCAAAASPLEPQVAKGWYGPPGGVYGGQVGKILDDYAAVYGGPAQESTEEVERRTLKADAKHLKRRLRNSESQVARLEGELRRLRAVLLGGTPLVTTDAEIVLPTTSKRKRRGALMGDAEAEHLLLAGRALSHVRRINRVPLTEAIAQQAGEIVAWVGPGQYSFPLEAALEVNATTAKSKRRRKSSVDGLSHRSTPELTKVTSAQPDRRNRVARGGAGLTLGLEELVQAAQTVFEPDLTEATDEGQPLAGPVRIAKRRRVSQETRGVNNGPAHLANDCLQDLQDNGPEGSPLPAESGSLFSALEVLAHQAEQSLGSPGPRLACATGDLGDPSAVGLCLPTSLLPVPPSGTNAAVLPLRLHPEGADTPLEVSDREEQLLANATRLRQPYIKWNTSEDALLVQAVLQNGHRWDQIAACLPTRSYHQCRQRWLRGLKSGDALPDELQHLRPELKAAVRDYEEHKAETKLPDSGEGEDEDSEDE